MPLFIEDGNDVLRPLRDLIIDIPIGRRLLHMQNGTPYEAFVESGATMPATPPETQAEIDAIADYREALRTLQSQYATPEQVIFPDAP